MDNCSIHSVEHVVASIHDVGALVHFLPPYLQPIEQAFSKVKMELKALEENNPVNSDYS